MTVSAMDPRDRDDLLLALFLRLRAEGLTLGIGELMAARCALDAGRADAGDEALKGLLRLLWCKSPAQQAALESAADQLLAEHRSAAAGPPEPPAPPTPEPLAPRPPPEQAPPEPPRPIAAPAPPPTAAIMPLPVRAPAIPPPGSTDPDLATDHPVTRRTMAYTWRYLRRPVKDGPCDRLDLPATVARAARQGFYAGPVLGRRTTDHGRLILLVDQGASMVPFHRLTRDLVQTAAESGLGRLDLAYFQNVPPARVYLDPHLTRPLPLARLLADCDAETAVALVSDAGAARGGSDPSRFEASARVLIAIRRLTTSVVWLNPVPRDRWPGTSAALIALLVPMFPMDDDGFSQAVEVLRGQPVGGRP